MCTWRSITKTSTYFSRVGTILKFFSLCVELGFKFKKRVSFCLKQVSSSWCKKNDKKMETHFSWWICEVVGYSYKVAFHVTHWKWHLYYYIKGFSLFLLCNILGFDFVHYHYYISFVHVVVGFKQSEQNEGTHQAMLTWQWEFILIWASGTIVRG